MADSAFETATKATLALLYSLGGKTCTYTRGAYTKSLTMLPPSAGMTVVSTEGVRARSLGGEFICKKADLILNSVVIEPARGDTITSAGGTKYDITDFEELIDTAEWRISVKEVDA